MLTRRLCVVAAAAVLLALPPFAQAQDAAPETGTPPASGSESSGVEDFLKSYTAAFNTGDAAQLGELWCEDATWESAVTGERAAGREEILADFADYFAENTGAKLTGTVDSKQEVVEGVVCLDGQTTLMLPGAEPVLGTYHAVLKADGGKWRLCRVVESAAPVLETTYTKLESLEPLVGEWEDNGDGPLVHTTFRWGTGKSFLIRSFTVEDEGVTSQGTQVIGWDPRAGTVRSWTFNSDGSFGEGTWSHSAGEWTGRLSQTMADGSTASATQVVRMIDNNTLEVETVGREVAGEPLPSTPPIRMTRVTTDQPAAGEEG
jgi:uncharacterized protein (TIGR02246 family)